VSPAGVTLARFGFSLDTVLSLSLSGSTPEKFSLSPGSEGGLFTQGVS